MQPPPELVGVCASYSRALELSMLSILTMLGQDLTRTQQARLRRLRRVAKRRLEVARVADAHTLVPGPSPGRRGL